MLYGVGNCVSFKLKALVIVTKIPQSASNSRFLECEEDYKLSKQRSGHLFVGCVDFCHNAQNLMKPGLKHQNTLPLKAEIQPLLLLHVLKQ